jgi:hypothetical protein
VLFIARGLPAAVELMPEDLVVVVRGAELSWQALDTTEGVEDIGAQREVADAEAIVEPPLVGRCERTRVLEVVKILRRAEVDVVTLDLPLAIVEEGEAFA